MIKEKIKIDLVRILEEREKELTRVIALGSKSLNKIPTGDLHVIRHGEKLQYYVRQSGQTNGKYIRKKDLDIAKRYAQKYYLSNIVKIAEQELCNIRRIRDFYNNITFENVYDNIDSKYTNLITPIYQSDADYIKEWLAQPFDHYDKYKNITDTVIFETERGDLMQSKSELLIKDILERYDIPYIYERPINLQGFGMVNPDFTILDMRTRTEIIWEHLGLMSDPTYCKNMLRKIAAYERNGFYLGQNLLVTYELRPNDFNVLQAEHMLRKRLELE